MYQYDKKPAPEGVLTATEQLILSQFMGCFSQYLQETTIKPNIDHEKSHYPIHNRNGKHAD